MFGWVRRHPIALAFVVVLVLVRVALPLALARIVADQASQALGAKITIADVDLALLRGAVAIEGVRLFALAPETPDEEILTDDSPLIAFDRLYVNLEWLDLPGQMIGISHASLERPVVRLERGEDGDLNLVKLFSHLAAQDDEEPEGESPWHYALTDMRITGGKVVFNDRTVAGEAVTIELDELGLDHFVWPLAGADRSGEFAVDLVSDGGRLSLRGTIDDAGGGAPHVVANVEAKNLRLVTGAAYVARIGWSDLRGQVDLTGSYEISGDSVHHASVVFKLRDTAVAVPGHDRPPLLWDSFEIAADADLKAARIDVHSVALRGVSLTVDLRNPVLLPLLTELVTSEDTTDAENTAPPSKRAEPERAADSADGQTTTWQWTVAEVAIPDAVLHVPAKNGPVDVVFEAAAKGVGSAPNTIASMQAGLSGPLGDFKIEATGGYQPIAASGEITWHDLLLDHIAAILPDERMGDLVRSGATTGKLGFRLEAVDELQGEGAPPAENGRALHIAGELEVVDLQLASYEPAEFVLGWRSLAVDLGEIVVPGIVPADGEPPPATSQGPVDAHLSSVSLDGWKMRMTRTADGVALPQIGTQEPTSGDEETDTEASPATESEPAVEAASPTDGSPPAAIVIDRLELAKCRVSVVDRTLAKPFEAMVAIDRLQTTNVGWPELRLKDLQANGKLLKAGIWRIAGSYTPDDAKMTFDFDRIPLLAISAPAAELTGFRVKRGDVDLDSKVRIRGGQFVSNNKVVLRDLSMSAPRGDTTFEDAFGMPLPLVLALLRDTAGNISLSVPVEGGVGEIRTGFATIIAGVVRQAVVGALTSPLKLVGALTTVGEGKIESLDLAHVEFVPARATLAEGADDRVRALARLLISRPEVALELRGVMTRLDVNVLKREWVAASLESGDDLPDIGWLQRRRLRGHVEALAAGERSELDDEDEQTFERLLTAVEIERATLNRIAKARAEKVAEILLQEYEVDPVQVPIINASTDEIEPARGRPRVEFDISGLD